MGFIRPLSREDPSDSGRAFRKAMGKFAMVQQESQSERMEKLPFPNLVHPEVVAMGKMRVDELVKCRRSF
jgi:hypothetical protein